MAFDLFKKIISRLRAPGQDDAPDIPQVVTSFLGNLGMLNNVPVYYLIPDERYLPLGSALLNNIEVEQGAFKFFWLDKEWIECLMDGALSIGNNEDRKLILTKAMGGNYVAEVYLSGKKARLKAQLTGTYSPHDFAAVFNDRIKTYLNSGSPEPTLAENNWCYTGFFMRSSLISGWPGVEVVAEGTDPGDTTGKVRPLQLIRMERIATDTLFCICEGIITQVVITQPAEALHFGMEDDQTVKGKKVSVSEPDRFCSGGVVDVASLADALGTGSSALFAQDMLVEPFKFIVNISWNPDNKS